ncbi:nitrate/nitrite transporter NrtS [Gilvimarinus polysaccharolyticus]|uniref:nitrate/nitrite transporter NrtS n=1 Tax=Gilvimarinus polysaccharolyticus TaxID=863921 RepID=UPI0006731783|nr:nitrate/nitrite transporter NrtS [Gilvimarinus polysaccharolyticus]
MNRFGRILISRQIVINALRIALVVGTLLNIINHGATLMDGLPIPWGHIAMNFIVPYCVASYSAAKNKMMNQEKKSKTI